MVSDEAPPRSRMHWWAATRRGLLALAVVLGALINVWLHRTLLEKSGRPDWSAYMGVCLLDIALTAVAAGLLVRSALWTRRAGLFRMVSVTVVVSVVIVLVAFVGFYWPWFIPQ